MMNFFTSSHLFGLLVSYSDLCPLRAGCEQKQKGARAHTDHCVPTVDCFFQFWPLRAAISLPIAVLLPQAEEVFFADEHSVDLAHAGRDAKVFCGILDEFRLRKLWRLLL